MVQQSASGYWQVFVGGALIGQSESESGAYRLLAAWERTHGSTESFLSR